MEEIGKLVILDVKARIGRGKNVDDEPAKPLKPGKNGKRGYPDRKAAKGLSTLRDLFWRGMTMRSIRVISSKANEVRIGFDNPQAATIAAVNQRRDPAWWFSPSNRQYIQQVVSDVTSNTDMVRAEGKQGEAPKKTPGRDAATGRLTKAA
jgi:hypothetical protein